MIHKGQAGNLKDGPEGIGNQVPKGQRFGDFLGTSKAKLKRPPGVVSGEELKSRSYPRNKPNIVDRSR